MVESTFRWMSPLGLSVGIFLAIGALWVFVGALTVPLHRPGAGAEYLFVSAPADRAYFGGTASDLLSANPAMSKLRTLLLTVIAGFLVLGGAFFILVAWFGLRSGQPWALATLAVGTLLGVVWWVWALLPYLRSGVRLTLGDIPPFMWVPALLVLPAVVLGSIGLR